MRRCDGSWPYSVHYSILRSEWPAAKDLLLRRLKAAAERRGVHVVVSLTGKHVPVVAV
jgi:hypothetical protein